MLNFRTLSFCLLSFFYSAVLQADVLQIPEGSELSVKFVAEQKLSATKSEFILMKPLSAKLPDGSEMHIPDYCLSSGEARFQAQKLVVHLTKMQCISDDRDILNTDYRADLVGSDGKFGMDFSCQENCVLKGKALEQLYIFKVIRQADFSIKLRKRSGS